MKGGNKYADTLHISVIGINFVCSLTGGIRFGCIMASNNCIGDHDIW